MYMATSLQATGLAAAPAALSSNRQLATSRVNVFRLNPVSGRSRQRLNSSSCAVSVRSMVADASPESNAMFAKEMERVAAKEGLLLAIKDAGGPSALSSGSGNDSAVIDVGEKLLALERLNPTPRPTSSPLLEGTWDFVWVGARSPGIIATKVLLKRFPPQVATLESLALTITENGTKATAVVKFFNTVETTVTLKSNLAMEGPLKLKEEYVEGVVSTPSVQDGSPLKPVVDQLASISSSLPDAIKDAMNAGLKVPLTGRYSRELLVSYLDDELLVARDQSGTPDVLVRAPVVPTLIVEEGVSFEEVEYLS